MYKDMQVYDNLEHFKKYFLIHLNNNNFDIETRERKKERNSSKRTNDLSVSLEDLLFKSREELIQKEFHRIPDFSLDEPIVVFYDNHWMFKSLKTFNQSNAESYLKRKIKEV